MHTEQKVDGNWVTNDHWETQDKGTEYESMYNNIYVDRNYGLFGLLCEGVRTSIKDAFPHRGLPKDACDEVREASDAYGIDGHSHSYVGLDELIEKFTNVKVKVLVGHLHHEYLSLAQTVDNLIKQLFSEDEIKSPEDYRMVFWFDN